MRRPHETPDDAILTSEHGELAIVRKIAAGAMVDAHARSHDRALWIEMCVRL